MYSFPLSQNSLRIAEGQQGLHLLGGEASNDGQDRRICVPQLRVRVKVGGLHTENQEARLLYFAMHHLSGAVFHSGCKWLKAQHLLEQMRMLSERCSMERVGAF